jgi:hypothetical protein
MRPASSSPTEAVAVALAVSASLSAASLARRSSRNCAVFSTMASFCLFLKPSCRLRLWLRTVSALRLAATCGRGGFAHIRASRWRWTAWDLATVGATLFGRRLRDRLWRLLPGRAAGPVNTSVVGRGDTSSRLTARGCSTTSTFARISRSMALR